MKERPKDLAFYEWRFAAWRTSTTRDMLDATGRGIYRELLDQCYAQGEFPADPIYICRVCACTLEQYEAAWPVISKHFVKGKNGALHNKKADLARRQYAAYVDGQRKRRLGGTEKSNESKQVHKLAPTTDDSRNDLTRTRTLQEQKQEQGHEQGKAKSARVRECAVMTISPGESEPGFWAEILHTRHPNKKDRVLVIGEVLKLWEEPGDPVASFRLIDEVHAGWCRSNRWKEQGGRFVPSLARWLSDRGWTASPPAEGPANSKLAGTMQWLDERDAR